MKASKMWLTVSHVGWLFALLVVSQVFMFKTKLDPFTTSGVIFAFTLAGALTMGVCGIIFHWAETGEWSL